MCGARRPGKAQGARPVGGARRTERKALARSKARTRYEPCPALSGVRSKGADRLSARFFSAQPCVTTYAARARHPRRGVGDGVIGGGIQACAPSAAGSARGRSRPSASLAPIARRAFRTGGYGRAGLATGRAPDITCNANLLTCVLTTAVRVDPTTEKCDDATEVCDDPVPEAPSDTAEEA